MGGLSWDVRGERPYETGVDRGVLYPMSGTGVPWNGLVAVKDAPVDTEVTDNHYDGQKFHQSGLPGSFAATIEAFTYPDEFETHALNGLVLSNQTRYPFGFSYRTMVETDAYKIHLVYNALTSPSARDNKSLAQTVDLNVYSWEISTTPIPIPGARPTAHLVVDSRIAYPAVLSEFEALLYGNDDQNPRLPTPSEVLEFFESRTRLRITNNRDGTWTAETSEPGIITMLDSTTFQIDWPSAVYVDSETYTIHSL